MQFSFKNRLAFNFLISTALIVAMLFVVIYAIVRYSVYSDVNNDIQEEIERHLAEMDVNHNIVNWIDIHEWEEREHNEISLDPVFVQIYDLQGNSIQKSPNLKLGSLKLSADIHKVYFFDTQLNEQAIRQVQVPVFNNNEIKGYLLIAMSLEEERTVLDNLLVILSLSYLILLISLFFITRFIAGESIRPITQITKTTSIISSKNLKSRISLPHKKDELYVLSNTINNLLDRIENAIEREKQFTSDASHELRTPLAVIKGTLEVLIRKPREKQEYEEKVNFCISEVDRLNNLVDQLLLLARFENQNENLKYENVCLNVILLESLTRFSQTINDKKIVVKHSFDKEFYITSDNHLLSIIFTNILSNAIKYSNASGKINIALHQENESIVCSVSDHGVGIPKEDLGKIFMPFYRSGLSDSSDTKGTGIGLSIVKRLCDLLKIEIKVTSVTSKGTNFMLIFKRRNQ